MAFTTTTTFVNHNHHNHSSLLMDDIFDDPFEKSILMVLQNDFSGETTATGKQLPKQQQQQQQQQQEQRRQGDVVVSGRQARRSLSPPTQNTMTKSNNNNNASMVYPAEWDHVTDVGDHDCLLGRGGGANKHSGNIKFRQLIKEYRFRYIEVPKIQKPKVAEEVVQVWRNMNPPGRFLARKNEKSETSSSSTPDSSKSSNDIINKNNNKNYDKKNEKKKDNDTKKKEKDDRLLLSDQDDEDEVWYDVGDKRARAKASMALRERTADAISFVKKLREEQDAKAKRGAILVQQKYPSSSTASPGGATSATTSQTASAPGSAPTSPARSVVRGIHQQFMASPHPPSPPQFLPRRGSDATLCSGLSDMHMAPHLQQQHLQQLQLQYHHHPLPHSGSLGKVTPGVQGRPMLHPSLSNPCFGGGAGGRPTLFSSISTPCFPAQPHSPPPSPRSPQSPHSTQSAPQFPGPAVPAPLLLQEQQQMQVRTMEEHLMRKHGELENLQQHILTMRRQRDEHAQRAQGQQQQQLSTSPPQASDCTPMMGGGVNISSKGATAAASHIMGEAANTILSPVAKTSSTIENDKNKNNTTRQDDDDRRNMEMYRSLLENYFDREQIQEEEVGSDLEDDDVDDWDHGFTSRNRDKRRRRNGGGGDKSAHDTQGGTRGKVLNTSGPSLSHHHPSHRPTCRRTADSTTSGSFHGGPHHNGDRAPRQGVARNKSNMSMQSTSSARSDDDLMAMSIISAELGYLSMDDRDDDEVHSLDGL